MQDQKIYKIAVFDISDGGIITIGEELYTNDDGCEMCNQLNSTYPQFDHVCFHPQRLEWDDLGVNFNPETDQFIIAADWWDDMRDFVAVRYSDERGDTGYIPTWQISNLSEVITKFNM